MDEHGRKQVGIFCRATGAQGAHSVAVWAKDADGLVVDIGEFEFETWTDRLTDGVLEWIDDWSTTVDVFELHALRKTGERCGGDECHKTLSTMTLGG